MPLELVEELHAASLSGDKRLLDKLILRVRETEDTVAQALQDLADRMNMMCWRVCWRMCVVLITGSHGFERTATLAIHDNPAVIAEPRT